MKGVRQRRATNGRERYTIRLLYTSSSTIGRRMPISLRQSQTEIGSSAIEVESEWINRRNDWSIRLSIHRESSCGPTQLRRISNCNHDLIDVSSLQVTTSPVYMIIGTGKRLIFGRASSVLDSNSHRPSGIQCNRILMSMFSPISQSVPSVRSVISVVEMLVDRRTNSSWNANRPPRRRSGEIPERSKQAIASSSR